jgi:hypothetical protein
LKLPATLVWNYPTVQQLATFLASKLTVASQAISTNVEKPVVDSKPESGKLGELVADIADLSDDEVMQSLLKGK